MFDLVPVPDQSTASRGGKRAGAGRKKSERPTNVNVATRVLAQAKRPLKDAAAVNATRWALFHTLKATGLPVEVASGGRTKWNRTRLGTPKTHALDAACVGAVEAITGWQRPMLAIKATGLGSYQRTRLDKYGFPRGYLTRSKRVHGFQTGDLVVATVTAGKKAGVHVGRVAIRATGRFNIQTAQSLIQGLSYRVCCLLQRADGYGYVLLAHTRKESENWGRAVHAALPLPGLNPKVSRGERGNFCVSGRKPVMEENRELSERLFPISCRHDGGKFRVFQGQKN